MQDQCINNICSIYIITNIVNSKTYIGQTWETIAERFLAHKEINRKSCIKLHNAFNKYGRENFIIKLITIAHTQAIADYWEIFFIKQYNSIKMDIIFVKVVRVESIRKKQNIKYHNL